MSESDRLLPHIRANYPYREVVFAQQNKTSGDYRQQVHAWKYMIVSVDIAFVINLFLMFICVQSERYGNANPQIAVIAISTAWLLSNTFLSVFKLFMCTSQCVFMGLCFIQMVVAIGCITGILLIDTRYHTEAVIATVILYCVAIAVQPIIGIVEMCRSIPDDIELIEI